MKMTIIPIDTVVAIDGVSFSGINMSSINPLIHAVQWHGSTGEIEWKNESGNIVKNESINSIDQFSNLINQFNTLKLNKENEQIEINAQQTVIEV